MGETLQPSDDLHATALAIAHDLWLTHLGEDDDSDIEPEVQAKRVGQMAKLMLESFGSPA